MSKTVLITGAAGFIGAHVVEDVLRNTDWNIVALDRLNYAGSLQRFISMDCWPKEHKRVKFCYHDLRAALVGNQVMAFTGKTDYIFHLAAESHVDNSLRNPALFAQSNVVGTVNMLEAARVLEPELFINFSTDEVFGSVVGDALHPETDPHRPSNPYAASKAGAEDFAHAFWRSYQIPIITTHTMNVFGERQSSEKFVPKTLKAILAGQPVTIHCRIENGIVVDISSRCWIHARNVASALRFLIDHHTAGEHYNIVGPRVDVKEMALRIAGFMDCSIKYDFVDFHSHNPAHDLHYGLDGSKMAALGWTPSVDFEDSLRRTVEWTVARPEWL